MNRSLSFARINGAIGNPLPEIIDHPGRKVGLWRHLGGQPAAVYRLDQEAVIGLARNDGRTGLASDLPTGPRIEKQATLGLAGFNRVTLVAMLDEHGTDPGLEELELCRLLRNRPRGSRESSKQGHGKQLSHGKAPFLVMKTSIHGLANLSV